jgi:hypothetical protein
MITSMNAFTIGSDLMSAMILTQSECPSSSAATNFADLNGLYRTIISDAGSFDD